VSALRVAVVGAGIGGLTAAHALRRVTAERGRALELRVLEAGDDAGGQLQSMREGGYLVEWAANAFRTGVGATADLVQRLGLQGERVEANPAANRRFILHGGRLHLLPSGPASLLTFAPMSLAGRLRVAAEPFVARRVPHEESVHDYASRHIGREAAEVLLGTMVRGVYGGDARQLSVDAAFPVMREMERDHRSLVVAGIRGAKQRRAEAKSTWSFRDGMHTLMRALADDLGDALRTAARVEGLEHDGDGFRLRLADGGAQRYDAVVLATPPRVTGPLLAALDPEAERDVAGIDAAAIAMVALAFPRGAFRTPPDGYGFLVAPSEPLDVLGVLFESNVFPGRAPEGHVLLRVIMGGAARPDIHEEGDDALRARARDVLEATLGLRAPEERSWIYRNPAAIPQYRLGHQARVARIEARLTAFPGLELAGNAYRGIAVGAIVEDAERVAQRIVARPSAARAA
jgi:protoporphyrinogen/coproporphyrinogen III oxidase